MYHQSSATMGDRQNANLRSIALTGFDRPNLLSNSIADLPPPTATDDDCTTNRSLNGFGNKSTSLDAIPATISSIDHPKLLAANLNFLKGVDLTIPSLANELAFAEAVATRNNPTTLDNVHRKLTNLPPYFSTFTKEQQEAFCRLVDSAEMKQALRLELKYKERTIRDQEMKYLSTDFGLGNVVHGWDISNPNGYTGTERQGTSTRLVNRRKVKDSDRIFSASSVMSFLTSSRVSKAKRSEMKKKRKEREKIKRHRKKQMSMQRHRLNAGRDKDSVDSEEESLEGNDSSYILTVEKESEVQAEESDDLNEMKDRDRMMRKKSLTTLKKVPKMGNSREPNGAGKTSQSLLPKIMKNIPFKQEKGGAETGHRLRTLLTNKAPHAASAGLHAQSLLSLEPLIPKEPIKLKIFKSRLTGHPEGSDIPASPSQSITTLDSNPELSAAVIPTGMPKRNRGRPRRLDT